MVKEAQTETQIFETPKEGLKLLTAAEILKADDFQYVDVDCRPFWPGSIRILALSAKEAFDFVGLGKHNDAMVRIVCKCAVDLKGNRLFTDDQLALLKEKKFAVFHKIQKATMKLNGLSDEEKNVSSEMS